MSGFLFQVTQVFISSNLSQLHSVSLLWNLPTYWPLRQPTASLLLRLTFPKYQPLQSSLLRPVGDLVKRFFGNKLGLVSPIAISVKVPTWRWFLCGFHLFPFKQFKDYNTWSTSFLPKKFILLWLLPFLHPSGHTARQLLVSFLHQWQTAFLLDVSE